MEKEECKKQEQQNTASPFLSTSAPEPKTTLLKFSENKNGVKNSEESNEQDK